MTTKPNEGVETTEEIAPTLPEGDQKPDTGVETKAEPEAPSGDDKDKDFYQQELERVLKERDNYKQGLLNEKEKNKKTEKETPDVEERIKEIQNMTLEYIVEQELDRVASSEGERALIKELWNTRIQKSGTDPQSIRNDIQSAQFLANQKKIEKALSEMNVSITSKQGMSTASYGSHQGSKETTGDDKAVEQFFNPDQIRNLKERGLDPKKVMENMKKNS